MFLLFLGDIDPLNLILNDAGAYMLSVLRFGRKSALFGKKKNMFLACFDAFAHFSLSIYIDGNFLIKISGDSTPYLLWFVYFKSKMWVSVLVTIPIFHTMLVGSRIEVPCAIRVLEVLKVFSYRFEDAESNERGLTSEKCGELSLEGVFQNGLQITVNWYYGA